VAAAAQGGLHRNFFFKMISKHFMNVRIEHKIILSIYFMFKTGFHAKIKKWPQRPKVGFNVRKVRWAFESSTNLFLKWL
jgi:hypothetical protein